MNNDNVTKYIFSSPIATAAIAAILLNKLLPRDIKG